MQLLGGAANGDIRNQRDIVETTIARLGDFNTGLWHDLT